jgi:glycosyltransferase involved in cell wall biosynthesis
MVIFHLTASFLFGGPERQMLGLAQSLPSEFRTAFVSFSETGLCRAFLAEAGRAGFAGIALEHDTPHLLAALKELTGVLRRLGAEILCCHGYKADLLGLLAARRIGIPAIAVSRGWTGMNRRVRLYEALDRLILPRMDKVVCVSAAQAEKVRSAGVREEKITVIHNAVHPERFARPDPACRDLLGRMFPQPPALIVGAAGRLSREKGFDVLIDAAAQVLKVESRESRVESSGSIPVGFILFGDGPLRNSLARQIAARGLENRFILAGFHQDLDDYLPHLDLFVQSSCTEGLPNVILEALAAGVPVVATAVGGTPEVIEDGQTGWLVPPGDTAVLAEHIASALSDTTVRERHSSAGRACVEDRFSFAVQARCYAQLFGQFVATGECVVKP